MNDEFLMDEEFLDRQRVAPRPQFAEQLYRSLSAPVPAPRGFIPPRRSIALGMVGLALAILVLVPSARASALDVIHRLGQLTIAPYDPTAATVEPTAAPPTGTPAPPTTAPDAAAASALVGFQVFEPASPPAGFAASGDWYVSNDQFGVAAGRHFTKAGTEFFVSYQQRRYPAGYSKTETYGLMEQVTPVTVRGRPGVIITGSKFGSPDEGQRLVVWLKWEDEGVNYTLWGDASADELLAMAESLQP
ncbi:MAG TPA: DUF4367 domain-containing protein [Herpetosiphonaceae bacterium]